MAKRTNQYRLQLEAVSLAKTDAPLHAPLTLDFDNHDDIFEIIEIIKKKQLFAEPNQAAEFAIGLKMFSEVMIKNRKHPLFEDLMPQFGAFMQKLKSYPAAGSKNNATGDAATNA